MSSSRMTGLGDLPEQCLASILCFASPKDTKRLALVSRGFREASKSNLALLPPHLDNFLGDVRDGASCDPRRELYRQLCQGVYVGEDGCRRNEILMVDPATGGMCRMLSAKAMTILAGDDKGYLDWLPMQGSRFEEVAFLEKVFSLKLQGRLRGYWWPDKYTVSFRLHHAEHPHGWDAYWYPVTFSLSVENGPTQQSSCYLDESQTADLESGYLSTRRGLFRPYSGLPRTRVREVGDGWVEYDIGELVVEDADTPVEVHFSMMANRGGHWKSGIYVDGVVIRPSYLVAEI